MSLAPAGGSGDDEVAAAAAAEELPAAALAFPQPPQTGDAEVDFATAEVAVGAATGGTLEDQLAGYEAAHRILQARLADVEG